MKPSLLIHVPTMATSSSRPFTVSCTQGHAGASLCVRGRRADHLSKHALAHQEVADGDALPAKHVELGQWLVAARATLLTWGVAALRKGTRPLRSSGPQGLVPVHPCTVTPLPGGADTPIFTRNSRSPTEMPGRDWLFLDTIGSLAPTGRGNHGGPGTPSDRREWRSRSTRSERRGRSPGRPDSNH